jgi:hypothetical protein
MGNGKEEYWFFQKAISVRTTLRTSSMRTEIARIQTF